MTIRDRARAAVATTEGRPMRRRAAVPAGDCGPPAGRERAGWCLDRYHDREWRAGRPNRISAAVQGLAFRLTMSHFRRLLDTSPGGLAAGGTRVGVIAASVLLYLWTAALVVVGAWLVRHRFPHPTMIPGLLLLGMAVLMAPRSGRPGVVGQRIGPEQAPVLHALVGTVAKAVGVRAPHAIVVNADFGAAAGVVGWRRRRVLFLGLALWGCLGPQHRVALLGHELGHFANGDARHAMVIRPAVATLHRLAKVLTPAAPVEPGRPLATVERLVGMLVRAGAAGFRLFPLETMAMLLRDGHRAEYLADQRAARLAGTRATAELLDLFVVPGAAAGLIASRARGGQTEQGWRAAAEELLRRQAPRLAWLRQLSAWREASLLSSHPPTGLRGKLVDAAGLREPALRLTEEGSARINAELARYYRWYRHEIALVHRLPGARAAAAGRGNDARKGPATAVSRPLDPAARRPRLEHDGSPVIGPTKEAAGGPRDTWIPVPRGRMG